MRRTAERIAALTSAFLLVAFTVILINQTAQLVQGASALSPVLGRMVLYTLLALYAGLLVIPLILYLTLPKPLSPPDSTESPEFRRFLAALRGRLSRNARLRGRSLETQQDIEAAIELLDEETNATVRAAASSVFLTTAICQSGRLDSLMVLSVQSRLVWQIAQIYYQRPSLRDLLSLYANVATTAFIAADIEDIDLDPVLSAIFGSAAAAIPGVGILMDSVVSGAANAFLTLRVGMVAKRYCNCLVKRERRLIKRSATLEAAKMVPIIAKENMTRLGKAAGGILAERIRRPWRKAVGADNAE